MITWHIANLFIEVVALTLVAIFYVYDDIESTAKADYYWIMTAKSQQQVNYYVDAFLLWLLYRFIRPTESSEQSNGKANALILVHDSERANNSLL